MQHCSIQEYESTSPSITSIHGFGKATTKVIHFQYEQQANYIREDVLKSKNKFTEAILEIMLVTGSSYATAIIQTGRSRGQNLRKVSNRPKYKESRPSENFKNSDHPWCLHIYL